MLIPTLIIVHSSLSGISVSPGTVIEAWQASPQRICVDNIESCPCDWYWVAHDFSIWFPDFGGDCPFDQGWSHRSAFSVSPFDTIKPDSPGVMYFVAISVDGEIVGGSWCGPADWSLNGIVDSTDFFSFLHDFFENQADINLSGRTDFVDFIVFVREYFSWLDTH